jgi:hypothetical protein
MDPRVQALRRRVKVVPDASLDKMAAAIAVAGLEIDAPAARPMDDARLEAKFRALAKGDADGLLARVHALEALEAFCAP